jgi:hypothetical protein
MFGVFVSWVFCSIREMGVGRFEGEMDDNKRYGKRVMILKLDFMGVVNVLEKNGGNFD